MIEDEVLEKDTCIRGTLGLFRSANNHKLRTETQVTFLASLEGGKPPKIKEVLFFLIRKEIYDDYISELELFKFTLNEQNFFTKLRAEITWGINHPHLVTLSRKINAKIAYFLKVLLTF
jgi:hypothetical protein